MRSMLYPPLIRRVSSPWAVAMAHFAAIFLVHGVCSGEATKASKTDLAAMQFERDAKISELPKPYAELTSKYRLAIMSKRDELQAAGDLRGVLACRQEIEALKELESSRSEFPPAVDTNSLEIRRMRQIAIGQKAFHLQRWQKDVLVIEQEHVANLRKKVTELTRRGMLEDALLFQNELEKAEKRLRSGDLVRPKSLKEGTGKEFVLISSGRFIMGRTEMDEDMPDAPRVTVNVSAFYIAKYEVTKALWDEVRAWALVNGYTDLPAGGGKAPNHPVHSINWFEAVKWCNARSQKERFAPVYTVSGAIMKTGETAPSANWSANGYRLPTQAEWEKAGRFGVSGKHFPWGTNTITHAQANYKSSTAYSYDTSSTRGFHPTYDDGTQPYTSPVGSFAANGYGLHDMAGNVGEWCWDWNSRCAYTEGSTDPRGPNTGSDRVFRGGSWFHDADFCRVAFHNVAASTTAKHSDIGFRLARRSVP